MPMFEIIEAECIESHKEYIGSDYWHDCGSI